MIRLALRRVMLPLVLLGLSLMPSPATSSPDARVRELGMTPLDGKPAPGFSLKTLDGAETALETLQGRVVILYFWATW
jgi:cytochrome c biogenesis protein CcmG/thiol:disulfide interchange protein DsbE